MTVKSLAHTPSRLILVAIAAILALTFNNHGASAEATSDTKCGKEACSAPTRATRSNRAYQWPSFESVFSTGTQFIHEGCNTVSYGTTPNFGNFMIGRARNGDPFTGSCIFDKKRGMSLTWVQVDYFKQKVTYLYTLFDTTNPVPVEGGRSIILSAYDATVAPFDEEYWVAFECNVKVYSNASSCMGPLIFNWATGKVQMDASRVSVVATGTGAKPFGTAASVPKLVAHEGRLYIYWDSLVIDMTGARRNDWPPTADVQRTFLSVNVRGAEVTKNPSSGRMYIAGHSSAISGLDPSASVEVMANADMFQVIDYQGNLIAAGGLTQAGDSPETTCALPPNNVPYCYRQFFAQTRSPLAYHGFQLIPSEAGGSAAMAANLPTSKSASFSSQTFGQSGVLAQGQALSIQNSKFRLAMQADGNLVFYQGRTPLWATGTQQSCTPCFAKLQEDGNFVIYNGESAYWSTQTNGNPGARLILSTTAPHVRIEAPDSSPLWASSANESIGDDGIPNQPQAYYRFVYRPDTRQTVLMGGVNFDVRWVQMKSGRRALTSVSLIRPWPDPLLQPVCDPLTKPYPTYMEIDSRCQRMK